MVLVMMTAARCRPRPSPCAGWEYGRAPSWLCGVSTSSGTEDLLSETESTMQRNIHLPHQARDGDQPLARGLGRCMRRAEKASIREPGVRVSFSPWVQGCMLARGTNHLHRYFIEAAEA